MTSSKPRLEYIDNLRVLLTALVVLHHAAVTYGSVGGWYYREGRQDEPTVILLGWFCAVNQAYFMSFFFMLSGFFTPGSLRKKGAGGFAKDRLMRLAIPLVIFDQMVHSALVYAGRVVVDGYADGFQSFFRNEFPQFAGIGRGPLWYVEALLIFTFAYLIYRRFFPAKPRGDTDSRFPSTAAIVVFSVAMGAAAFCVRLWMPVGDSLPLTNLQLPYFPLYIAFFVIGIAASESGWLEKLPASSARRGLAAAVFFILMCPVIFIAGGAMKEGGDAFLGGFRWQALTYAMWEPFLCVSMIVGLTALFRQRFNRRGPTLKFLAESSYAAYLVHSVVLVSLSYACRGWGAHAIIKFALVGAVAAAGSFLAGGALRRLPGAKRVL